MRVDEYITQSEAVRSRSHVKDLIKRGKVYLNGSLVTKASLKIDPTQSYRLKITEELYVSRGALKLVHALQRLRLQLDEKIIADVGASTGGFTQVALQKGAAKVYAIDVGTHQLDHKIQQDPRVVDISPVNVADYKPIEPIDLVVCDVSFVSAEYILPILKKIFECPILFLFKPQFNGTSSKGVIHSQEGTRRLTTLTRWLNTEGQFEIVDAFHSKVRGKQGNQEFWLYLSPKESKTKTDLNRDN